MARVPITRVPITPKTPVDPESLLARCGCPTVAEPSDSTKRSKGSRPGNGASAAARGVPAARTHRRGARAPAPLAPFRPTHAQGYSARDLSRVTVVPNPHDAIVRVVAFGRVSLFGPGAARLHDELVGVAAQWLESKGKGHLRPFGDEADRRALETLEQLFKGLVERARRSR